MARNLIIKAADQAGVIVDVIVITCLGIILLYPGLLLNEFLKGKIEKAFADSNPGYSLTIGNMDYKIFSNRVEFNKGKFPLILLKVL